MYLLEDNSDSGYHATVIVKVAHLVGLVGLIRGAGGLGIYQKSIS